MCSLQGCTQEKNTITSLTYKASSRGLFYDIALSSQMISIQKERSSNKRSEVAIPEKSWEELQKLLEKLPTDIAENTEVESEKLWIDAAIQGELSLIRVKGTATTIIHLDHSNPPAELKPLIDRILSLAESVE